MPTYRSSSLVRNQAESTLSFSGVSSPLSLMVATISTFLFLLHSVLTHKAVGIAYSGSTFLKNAVAVLILFSFCSKWASEDSVKFGINLFYLYAKLISSVYKFVWRLQRLAC